MDLDLFSTILQIRDNRSEQLEKNKFWTNIHLPKPPKSLYDQYIHPVQYGMN